MGTLLPLLAASHSLNASVIFFNFVNGRSAASELYFAPTHFISFLHHGDLRKREGEEIRKRCGTSIFVSIHCLA